MLFIQEIYLPVPLSDEEKMSLASCDKTTHYLTTFVSNLKPSVEYEVVVEAVYNSVDGVLKQKCQEGLCITLTKIRISGDEIDELL